MQWNVNFQRSLGADYLVEAAYTGSRSRSLSKRYNINQAGFGTTDINTRLPFPQFQPAMLYSAAIGTADFKGLSLRFEKRYSAGLFFLANYQLSENRDNGSGEVEANDTAFRTDFDADESLSRYHQRHRGAFSFGYELPFGQGRPLVEQRRRRRVRARRVAGAKHHPRRQRLPVHVVGHERLPVRVVRPSARQLCSRTRRRSRRAR